MPYHQPHHSRIGVGPWIGTKLLCLLAVGSGLDALALAQNLDAARLLPSGSQRNSTVTIELPGKFEKWFDRGDLDRTDSNATDPVGSQ